MKTSPKSKRINVVLPLTTLKLIDKVTKKGNRSRLIDEAVLLHIHHTMDNDLKEALKEGYIQNAERDRIIANEWSSLEETENETW